MEIILILVIIVQSFAISLGVGSSTIAVINFFVAIGDGTIDVSERKIMGVTYRLLRLAMWAILFTTGLLIFVTILGGGVQALTTYAVAQLVLIFVLFLNAALMTKRIMPSAFGPAIQAGSWYTLGTLAALVPLSLTSFTYLQFFLGYVTALTLAVSLINGVMAYQKEHRPVTPTTI